MAQALSQLMNHVWLVGENVVIKILHGYDLVFRLDRPSAAYIGQGRICRQECGLASRLEVRQAQTLKLVRERNLENPQESSIALMTQIVERIVQVTQLAILVQPCENRGKACISNIIAMKDQFLNQGLFSLLLRQVLLHRYAIALIQVVALQFEHVAADLGKDWEGHDLLVIAAIHIVDVRVLKSVMLDRLLGKLVEYVLVHMLCSSFILILPLLVVVVKSFNQLCEGILEMTRLHELLQDELGSLHDRLATGLTDLLLLVEQR